MLNCFTPPASDAVARRSPLGVPGCPASLAKDYSLNAVCTFRHLSDANTFQKILPRALSGAWGRTPLSTGCRLAARGSERRRELVDARRTVRDAEALGGGRVAVMGEAFALERDAAAARGRRGRALGLGPLRVVLLGRRRRLAGGLVLAGVVARGEHDLQSEEAQESCELRTEHMHHITFLSCRTSPPLGALTWK